LYKPLWRGEGGFNGNFEEMAVLSLCLRSGLYKAVRQGDYPGWMLGLPVLGSLPELPKAAQGGNLPAMRSQKEKIIRAEAQGRGKRMPDYRISYFTNGVGEESCNLSREHEFFAIDDRAAEQEYKKFVKEKEKDSQGDYSPRYSFLFLERIDQREITTIIC